MGWFVCCYRLHSHHSLQSQKHARNFLLMLREPVKSIKKKQSSIENPLNDKQMDQMLTCTRWHCIKLCICVKILKTMCSIVLCSSKIIRAKSNSTWFRLTSSWDFSYNCAFRRPMPQNCKYDEKIFSSFSVNRSQFNLLITCATPITSPDESLIGMQSNAFVR